MFSAADLANMRTTQDAHMMDTCVFQACVQTKDTHGQEVETFPADSADVVCGLDMRPGMERHKPDMTVVEYDAVIRLPIASAPDPKDRIKVTKRFDEDTTDIVFEIVGPVQRGPSGVRVLLKRVVT